jgi:hypothetical protein
VASPAATVAPMKLRRPILVACVDCGVCFSFKAFPRKVEIFIASYGTERLTTPMRLAPRVEPQIVPCGCTIGSESAKTIHWVSSFGTKSFTGDPRTTNSTAYNLQSVCQNSDDCQFLVRVISCEFVDRVLLREKRSTKSHEITPTRFPGQVRV